MRGLIKRKLQRISHHTVKEKIFTGREEFFKENGKLLLEERILLFHGKTNPIRCFSAYEINAMITKVNHDLSSEFKWYNGNVDGRAVLIKLQKNHQVGCLVREAAIAAQMSTHKNVLKLLGCCLETQHPVLVYESNVQSECLHMKLKDPRLEWKDRLRIAREISYSVAYLHSAFPRPIVHRDLKPSHVLLDKDNVAKLSGFFLSVSMPEGEPYLELHQIAGTYGYLAPECLKHAKMTEKSDVYSFGMLFLELLTGERAVNLIQRMEAEERSNNVLDSFDVELYGSDGGLPSSGTEWDWSVLEKQVRKCLETKYLTKTSDPVIMERTEAAANEDLVVHQQLKESMDLAFRCIKMEIGSRPTMAEVASQLDNIISASYELSILTADTC